MIWRVRHQSSVSNCTYESERFDLRLIGAYFVLRRADPTLLETHTYSPSYSTAVMTPVGAWIDVHVFPNARTTVLPNCLDIFAASDWRALGPKAASPTAATFPFPISLSEGCEKKDVFQDVASSLLSTSTLLGLDLMDSLDFLDFLSPLNCPRFIGTDSRHLPCKQFISNPSLISRGHYFRCNFQRSLRST